MRSVSGNLLTVVALLRCPKLRSHATTAFVISLACSDLLFAGINLPLTASRYIHQQWILGDFLCRCVNARLASSIETDICCAFSSALFVHASLARSE